MLEYCKFTDFLKTKNIVASLNPIDEASYGFTKKKTVDGLPKGHEEISPEEMEAASDEVAKMYQAYSIIYRKIDEAARDYAKSNNLPLWSKKKIAPPEILNEIKPDDVVQKILTSSDRFTKTQFDPKDLLIGRGRKAANEDPTKAIKSKVVHAITTMVQSKEPNEWLMRNIMTPILSKVQDQYPSVIYQTMQYQLNRWIKEVEKWAEEDANNWKEVDGKWERTAPADDMPKLSFKPPKEITQSDEEEVARIGELLKDEDRYDKYIVKTAEIGVRSARKILAADGITSITLREKGIDDYQMQAWGEDGINKGRKDPSKIKDFFNDVNRIGWASQEVRSQVANIFSRKTTSLGGSSEMDLLPPGDRGISKSDQAEDQAQALDALKLLKPYMLKDREVQHRIVMLAKNDPRIKDTVKELIDPTNPDDPYKAIYDKIIEAEGKPKKLEYVQVLNAMAMISKLEKMGNIFSAKPTIDQLAQYAPLSDKIMNAILSRVDHKDPNNVFTVLYNKIKGSK